MPQLTHAVFTRHGGVSVPPYDTLNTGYSSGDRPEAVMKNIQRIKNILNADQVLHLNQSHGNDIFVLNEDNCAERKKVPSADAVITHLSRIALLINQADCQGVILYDQNKNIVAHVHCGWRGNVKNILADVVIHMKKIYDCRQSDLRAGIGPSLGPCCAEFVDYKSMFPAEFERFMVRKNHFDLWAISCGQLEDAGLKSENIEVAGICTRCRTDLFYSYRKEGKTGRFATVAMLG